MKFAIALIRHAPVVIIAVGARPVFRLQERGVHRHGRQSVEQVLAAASALGIDRTDYARYAAMRWGSGWASQADCCREALDQIERYRHDAEGLIDKIEVELRTAETIGR